MIASNSSPLAASSMVRALSLRSLLSEVGREGCLQMEEGEAREATRRAMGKRVAAKWGARERCALLGGRGEGGEYNEAMAGNERVGKDLRFLGCPLGLNEDIAPLKGGIGYRCRQGGRGGRWHAGTGIACTMVKIAECGEDPRGRERMALDGIGGDGSGRE